MLNHILNAVGAVGNAIDLPGSSVRDVLAGRNPLDQWRTPLSDVNRTSGRELLRHHGLAGSKDTWGNFAGGMLAEGVLDPTNFIPGVTIGKAARAKQLAQQSNLSRTAALGANAAAQADNLAVDYARSAASDVSRHAREQAPYSNAIPALPADKTIKVSHRDPNSYFDTSDGSDFASRLRQTGNALSRERLVYMHPQDFINVAHPLVNVRPDSMKYLRNKIETGGVFPSVPYLNFKHHANGTAYVTGHEGRHRARVLLDEGVDKMPVVMNSQNSMIGDEIRWGVQGDQRRRINGEWPKILKDETYPVAYAPRGESKIGGLRRQYWLESELDPSKTSNMMQFPIGDTGLDEVGQAIAMDNIRRELAKRKSIIRVGDGVSSNHAPKSFADQPLLSPSIPAYRDLQPVPNHVPVPKVHPAAMKALLYNALARGGAQQGRQGR